VIPSVALTTTANRAVELAPVARAHGLRPVVLPCIEVVPARESVLEEARRSAAASDWLLVTSARTVEYLWPHGRFPEVEVAAVGAATAAAVTDAGGTVRLVGSSGSIDLISVLVAMVEDATVCFPHGRGADISKGQSLAEAGGKVSTWEVYTTESMPPALDPVDAVAFGSPSAVDGWSQSRDFAGVAVGAIGKTTAMALSGRGHSVDVVADPPEYGKLLEQLSSSLRNRAKA
jgi:uroporphyrinogen-III synthase